jgi:hypothetical protein
MPKFISRRWAEDDIAKLKDMAQKYPVAQIASQLGRGISATRVKAHLLKLSLRMSRPCDPQAISGRGSLDIELRD